jgi:L-ascorbate metabolism protein UlaG (beta-lactamase superfamily)
MSFSYPKSDHYDGKIFFNPNEPGQISFWDVLKWKLTSEKMDWPRHLPNKKYPMRLLASDQKVSATFINHATFLIQLQGLNILTDPMFSDRASPFSFIGPKRVREVGISFDLLPPVDVVIISHNHYDHLDLKSLKMIDEKFHPLFLVPLGDEMTLLQEGILRVKPMDWWEEQRVKDVRFIFAPAQHWSSRKMWDKNTALWGSFMIDNGHQKIYFAGDTGPGKHFLEIRNRLGAPDLALIPIGAYKPEWFMKFHHLSPREAVAAHVDLKAQRSVAMHFGTFQMSDEAIDQPVKDLKSALNEFHISHDEFMILDQGDALTY